MFVLGTLTPVDGHTHTAVLTDFAHLPEMMMNFISQSRVRKAEFITIVNSIS